MIVVGCLANASCGGSSAPIQPATMPASEHIAFVALDGTVRHLYLMGVSATGVGNNPRRITCDTQDETYPTWSPDGTRLTYQGGSNGSAVYVINADGAGESRLSPTPGMDATPSWSPDGTKIIYAHLYAAPQPNQPPMTDIRIMNADGTNNHAILTNTLFSVEPRWSVNNQVVFISLMSGAELEVFEMNSDGSNLQQLTTLGNNGEPVWSADAKRITLEYDVGGMKQSSSTAFAQVWTMNADGSNSITTGIQCSDVGCSPRWQP